MGSILSNEHSLQPKQTNDNKESQKIAKQWQVLQKTAQKQILRSKKTALLVQRYSFDIENHQDLQSQNKIFQWRNHNPNSEFIVNVLSVGKDDCNQDESRFECGSIQWCPSQKVKIKVFVVTQRILKLGEIMHVLNFQKEMEGSSEQNKPKPIYATEQNSSRTQNNKTYLKIQPFIGINYSQSLARQLLKDWIRSIEVLCYKFGYFNISENNLGMSLRKRGTAWISSNYACNHLDPANKIQVNTAEQKFKYERETIQKIILLTQKIPCFSNTMKLVKHKKIQRFDEFSSIMDLISKNKKHARQLTSYEPQAKKGNNSLYVQHGSFVLPHGQMLNSNSSFFMFDQHGALNRVNSHMRLNPNQQQVASLQVSSRKKQIKQLTNSGNSNQEAVRRQIKRSNTGDNKVGVNLSPQSKKQINFVSSGHQCCGKETAPTNQLGHSSSLQSVNHPAVLIKASFSQLNENNQQHPNKTLFKSQNLVKPQPHTENHNQLFPQLTNPNNNKVYHHHNNSKQSFSSQPYLFRSEAIKDVKSPKTSRPHQNLSFNSPLHRSPNDQYHNYSLDENNIVGPYRKERIYSNLKKQKIALVDSMVMVRQQSEQVEEDIHSLSRGKYVLQESIIIMGRNEDPILTQIYR